MTTPTTTTQGSSGTDISRLEAPLTRWGATLDEIVAKAKDAAKPAKVEWGKQIHDLRSKLRDARTKLDAAKQAGAGRWETFKHGVEHTWKDLEGAFERLGH